MGNTVINWILSVRPTQKEAATHLDLGKELMSAVPGLKLTTDAYGKGPQPHGSAYKAPGTVLEDIAAYLVKQGYGRTKNNLKKGALLVELGTDGKETFAYVTDDNK